MFYFSCSGEGKGGSEAQGGGVCSIANPTGSLRRGKGGERPEGCLRGNSMWGGGALSAFFRVRNSHQGLECCKWGGLSQSEDI